MADLKTKPTEASVLEFLNSIENETRRKDGFRLLELFNSIMDEPAVMWGDSIVGYGTYHYKYESGHEGDMLITGFSPRKQNFSLYIMPGFTGKEELLDKLGKHKLGKSCLYINKLADVDLMVLKELIEKGVKYMREKYD